MAQHPISRRIVVGITGASGAAYARRLLQCLCNVGVEAHVVVTPHGKQLLHDELGMTRIAADTLIERGSERLILHGYRDLGAVISSGSFRTDGMIVCPCSSNTLGALASGLADNLLNRAAAVTLKEARRLIVVPREMPLSPIDLRNALRLSDAGTIICPASPGFYMKPTRLADLVDFVVGKLLDLVDVPHELDTRWTGHGDATPAPTQDVTEA
ncbi:MAG: UbiX family flavin prenyltransferase [Phycisphaerae bacterium]|jgi:4-hydroxy-3-polyprenylbenzoate decarboxylase